ncbi:MAG: hypothetical protein GF384_04575, partial [Elusimicrobia bacterium]|nr:hypothetical protein [Elusimicrobiota bacterium]
MNTELSKKMLFLSLSISALVLSHTFTFALEVTELSQYGITWAFDQPREVGQFANGDWWVVGPVTITEIDPAPTGGRNGTMKNPAASNQQGYDDRGVRFNQDLYITPPIKLQPGDCIISSESLDEMERKSWLKKMAILTVVDTPQHPNKFRPPYTRPHRVPQSAHDELIFSDDDIQWDILLNLASVPSTPDPLATAMTLRKIVPEHAQGWDTRNHVTPAEHHSIYGREIANTVGALSLLLLTDLDREDKMPVAISLIQYGIDLYGVMLDGGEWHADGGIYHGRKWPILFTGLLLDDENAQTEHDDAMRSIGSVSIDAVGYKGPGYIQFQEDEQTFYVTGH